MVNIRLYTRIIIEKDDMYLVGREILTGNLRWSDSPYDAWHTRAKDKAYIVCCAVRGKRMLFNPVVKQLREMRIGSTVTN